MSSSSSSSGSSSPPPSPPKRKRDDSDSSEDDSSDSEQSEAQAEPNDDDEPVLSHAAQRKQKKAAAKLAAKKATTGDYDVPTSSKKRKLADGSSTTTTTSAIPVPANKRQNSVWVGNMSYKTQQADLKNFFAEAGEVVRMYMPTKPPLNPSMKPENRGFAYVDFATPEGKVAAIAKSEQPLTGRKLLIKDGDDFTGRPAPAAKTDDAGQDGSSPTTTTTTHSKTAQKILKLQKQPPAPTLFIGNLGFETTEQNIRELFEAHRANKGKGKEVAKTPVTEDTEGGGTKKDIWIRKIRMGTFEDSGKCKGWAFADFTSIEDATSVLINPKNHYLNGRKLNIEYASPDAVRRGQPGGGGGAGRKPAEGGRGPPRERRSSGPRKERPVRERGEFEPRRERAQQRDEGEEEAPVQQEEERRPRSFKGRPRPGAALASAVRQSAAIVESQGKKITF